MSAMENDIHPTLVVGIGGTGRDAVKFLKKRFIEEFDEVPDLVKFLVFDTTKDTNHVLTEDGREVSLSNVEFKFIGGIDLDKIFDDISLYPKIDEWLPEPRKNFKVGRLVDGAGMIRSLGRLSIYWNSSAVMESLQSQLRALNSLKTKDRLGKTGQGSISVWIVSSVCGGTGSGIFIDTAYLVAGAAKKVGITTNLKRIGVLLLPGAFQKVLEPALLDRAKANAFTALTELDYEMEHPRKDISYLENTIHLNSPKPVFDVAFLIDSVNEEGNTLNDNEEMAMMIAENLFLMVSTQIGKASSDNAINIFAGVNALGNTFRGKRARYSSFGVTSFVLPVNKIIRSCKYRLADLIVKAYISNDKPEEEISKYVDSQVEDLLNKLSFNSKDLETYFSVDDDGKKIAIGDLSRTIQKLYEAKKLQSALSLIDRPEKVLNKKENVIKGRVDTYLSKVRDAINSEVDQLLNNPEYGISYATKFLEKLNESISAVQERLLNGKEEELNEKIESIGRRLKRNDKPQINEVDASKNIFSKTKRMKYALEQYSADLRKWLELKLEEYKLKVYTSIFSSLRSDDIEPRKRQLEYVVGMLSSLSNGFEKEAAFKTNMDNGITFLLEKSVVKPEDIKVYFDEVVKDKVSELTDFINEYGKLTDYEIWANDSNETKEEIDKFKNNVLEYATKKFDPYIRKKQIEKEIFDTLHKFNKPEDCLKYMYDKASPFWNYTAEKLGEKHTISESTLLGVYDSTKTVFKDANIQAKPSLVSMGDLHRITMQRSKHGLPLFALNSMDEYKRIYEEYQNSVAEEDAPPLHITKDPEGGWPDIMPISQEEELKKWFVLALRVFNGKGLSKDVCQVKIEKHATVFYANRNPKFESKLEDSSPIQLGRGYDASLKAFIKKPDLVKEYEDWINSEVTKMGNDKAIQIINNVLSDESINFHPGEKRLILRYKGELEEM